MKWGRKFFAFITTVLLLEFSAFIFLLLGFHVIGDKELAFGYFSLIVDKIFLLSVSFFCSNAIEHVSKIFVNKKAVNK